MGFLDIFKGGNKGDKGDKKGSPAAKWAEPAGNRRALNYDRQEAIQALAAMGTPEAVTALLKRFTFQIDPSITDQEEKDAAFRGILRAEREAIEPVRRFAARAESLAWPMRILKELLAEDEYVAELVLWLERWDTEYSKFIDPKIQLLIALEERKSDIIRPAVEPFLDDVNETARFHAVATLLAQEDKGALPALLNLLAEEESVRVKNKVADGIANRGWVIPEEARDAVRKTLPPSCTIDATGHLHKRS
jgi:HEAT repeat protein